MVAYWTSSSRVEQCPDKCFVKAWEHELGAKSSLSGGLFNVRELKFCIKLRGCCVVCGWALSWGRSTPSLRRPRRFAHRRQILRLTVRDMFAKLVTAFDCHSSARSANVPGTTWPWTLQPSVVYINSVQNFNEFHFLKNWYCKVLISTLVYYYPCPYQCTRVSYYLRHCGVFYYPTLEKSATLKDQLERKQ
jgi:hypothetical protein